MVKKTIGAALFIFIIFLFCYFRLKPLYFQTVGYTYDQGRDFLKAAEIIRDRNLTFIGPTTGIPGLFHGAWYYYLLIIPYLLFGGLPIGFYYFNFFIHLLSLLVLMFFLKKWFGSAISILIGSFIATSPYFIFTSLFVGNNIFVLPLLVFFSICNYYIFNTNKQPNKKLWFLAGLIVSFIFEFEVAFGLFLVPSYILILLFNKQIRKNLFKNKSFLPFTTGFIIPYLPRLLFEFKNNFFQIKTLFSFFFKPKIFNPRSFKELFLDRFYLFLGYFKGIFPHDFIFYSFILLLLVSLIIVLAKRKKTDFKTVNFFSAIILLLFIFSLFYKDSFWANYYEGIQYLFLILSANIFFPALNKQKFTLIFIILVLLINLSFATKSVASDWNKKPKETLLKNQTSIVDYVTNQTKLEKDKQYCVKVYTPPVIPFTYRYLFLYKNISTKIPEPKDEWIDRECWFIIESDDNQERRAEWLKNNIPRKAKLTQKKLFNDVETRHYELD